MQHAPDVATLLTVGQVAAMIQCSQRHVYRLEERRELPPAVRLGAVVRWRRGEIEEWIAAGCPKNAA